MFAETSAASGKKLAAIETSIDDGGVTLNGVADITSKPRAEFLAGLPGIANHAN
jgi:hypothetical protein